MNSEDRIGLTSLSKSTPNLDNMHGLATDTSTYDTGYFAFVTGQFTLLVVFTLKNEQSEVPL